MNDCVRPEDYVPCSRTVYVVGPVPYFVCGQAPDSPIHKIGPSGTHPYQPDLVTALERSLRPQDRDSRGAVLTGESGPGTSGAGLGGATAASPTGEARNAEAQA